MATDTDIQIVIRPATEADDVVAGDLLVEAFVVQYGRKMPDVVVTESRKSDLRAVALRRKTARVLVAEVEGEVAGTATVFPPGDRGSKTRDPRAAEMRYLAVGLGFTGTGVASKLVAAAEGEARRFGAPTLVLHVRRGATGVARFYEQLGYERDPSDDADLPEIYLEAYRKKLGQPQPGT